MQDHRHFLRHPLPSPAPGPIAGGAETAPPQPALITHNAVLVLAAMTCAIVCALGLNSTLHCVVRCTRRAITDPADWVAARRLNSGLRREDVLALPVTVCAAAQPTMGEGSSPAVGHYCPICLTELTEGDKMRVLPACGHRFHVGCVDTWLVSHRSCPTCRCRLMSPAKSTSLEIL
ncbi:RING-H2 finger protein ATL44 [Platanthera guangdongensis]|uniref:RING-H2 finger protein ATL44 n=1 Tax=Platanthera guangdongensis TaxID=2320717 RepID=A0ABR2N4J5_9ASPA